MTKDGALKLIEKLDEILRHTFESRVYKQETEDLNKLIKSQIYILFKNNSDSLKNMFSEEFLDALKEPEKTALEVFREGRKLRNENRSCAIADLYYFCDKEIQIIEKALR